MKKGKLYLIPVSLGGQDWDNVPHYVVERLHQIDTFIVERARTARRFVSASRPPKAIAEMTFHELDKRDPAKGIAGFLKAAEAGEDIGLMSEAGCPGVADPGALVVEMAHRLGVEVVPMVGPSSILLALMASGMDGQRFCFHGYLPIKKPERQKVINRLEQQSRSLRQTQIFIETPYRNMGLLENLLGTLAPSTRLCVAADLSLPSEHIRSQRVADWRNAPLPDLKKRPAVFLFLA